MTDKETRNVSETKSAEDKPVRMGRRPRRRRRGGPAASPDAPRIGKSETGSSSSSSTPAPIPVIAPQSRTSEGGSSSEDSGSSKEGAPRSRGRRRGRGGRGSRGVVASEAPATQSEGTETPSREPRRERAETSDSRDSRDSRDTRDRSVASESSEGREGREARGGRRPRRPRSRGARDSRDSRDSRETRDSGDSRGRASRSESQAPVSAEAQAVETTEGASDTRRSEGPRRERGRRGDRSRRREPRSEQGSQEDTRSRRGAGGEDSRGPRRRSESSPRAERGERSERGRGDRSRGDRSSRGGDRSRGQRSGSDRGRRNERDDRRPRAEGGARGQRNRNDRRPSGNRPSGNRRPNPSAQSEANRNLKPTESLQMPPKPVTVLIAGGGTGGHVIPAISIAEALKNRNKESQITILGSNRGIERELVPKAGFELVELSVRGMPRKFGLNTVKALWQMAGAVKRCHTMIGEMKPDVVVGTGGYVSVAAVIAAKLRRKPTVLQEQNSIPGRSNRMLARFANEIHIHFTESRRFFKDRGKLRLSGNPVRIKIPEGNARRTLQKYRLFPDRKTVLILGGSQGARSLNDAFRKMLPHFRNDRSVQFVIQTGRNDYRAVLGSVRNSGARVVVKSFINNMEELYGVADLVVARAGAMTLAEIAACGIPSLLIPYPYAADDHQTANARALADKEAAVMMADSDLSGDTLAEEIRKLLADDIKLRRMGTLAYALSRPNAAKHVAESIEALAGAAPESILNTPEDYDAENLKQQEAR